MLDPGGSNLDSSESSCNKTTWKSRKCKCDFFCFTCSKDKERGFFLFNEPAQSLLILSSPREPAVLNESHLGQGKKGALTLTAPERGYHVGLGLELSVHPGTKKLLSLHLHTKKPWYLPSWWPPNSREHRASYHLLFEKEIAVRSTCVLRKSTTATIM